MKNKKVIVYPGSFDPFTLGHKDLVDRALKMFDHVIIAVLKNPQKDLLLDPEERIKVIKSYFQDSEAVTIDTFEGLLVDYLKEKEVNLIMRGMRMLSDFEYEFQMSLTNRNLYCDFEAIYLVPAMELSFISSSIVREIAKFKGELKGLVNKETAAILYEKFK
ncbi:pantetheine-phosphate adenylyltransferase [bacterium]|nr:pantetheine-phosphate adenylyltransferase [bacterium]